MLAQFLLALFVMGMLKIVSVVQANQRAAAPITAPRVYAVIPSPLRELLPNLDFLAINPRDRTAYANDLKNYERADKEGRSTVFSIRSPFSSRAVFRVADAGAARQLSIRRADFVKPVEMYKPVNFFGDSLVTTEGPTWKHHRKIIAPAFAERTHALVWDQASSIFAEMLAGERWTSDTKGREYLVKDMVHVTMKIALMVIARAAFTIEMSWGDDKSTTLASTPSSKWHAMSAAQALAIVSTSTVVRILTPKWLYLLPIPSLQRVETAFVELESHLDEMIAERRADQIAKAQRGEEEEDDLFAMLVRATMEDEEKVASRPQGGEEEGDEIRVKFGKQEVLGNTFMLLLAGHETSGHTLAFFFAMMALHPEEQSKIRAQIDEVCGEREPVYEDFPKFTYALAAFNETLRLFTPVTPIPKTALEDTHLTYTLLPLEASFTVGDSAPETRTTFIPKGSDLLIDTPALHHNPLYWKHPAKFDPSRFLGDDWDRDAFLPFSQGPRGCVGRRFAEVEAICIIVAFLRRFEIFARPRKGETEEQMRERLVRGRIVLTLTPAGEMDLGLRRRG